MDPRRHGTTTGYARGCRCDACREAVRVYQRQLRGDKRAGTWQDKRSGRAPSQQCVGPDCDRPARFLTRHGEPLPLCNGHRQQVDRGVELSPLRRKRFATATEKQCSICDQRLPHDQFHKQGDRLVSQCKPCLSIYTRARRYGVSFEVMAEMLSRPCEGCGAEGLTGKKLHVDHCHDTGKVRGVLCSNCNAVLTKHVTPETLRRLAAYLER